MPSSNDSSTEMRVARVVAPVVGIPVQELIEAPQRNLVEELGLDSVGAVTLLVNLEQEFGVKVPAHMLTELVSVRSIAHAFESMQG
jgi:acyl carrier protein